MTKGSPVVCQLETLSRGRKYGPTGNLNAAMATRNFSHCLNRAESSFQSEKEKALKVHMPPICFLLMFLNIKL